MVYITAAELLDLQATVDEGKATLQAYANPPEITLRRRDASGTFQTVAQFTPVTIRLADRLEQVTSANGRVDQVNTGSFETTSAIDVRRDDRFTLEGQVCVVTLVEPVKNIYGYRDVQFMFLGGA